MGCRAQCSRRISGIRILERVSWNDKSRLLETRRLTDEIFEVVKLLVMARSGSDHGSGCNRQNGRRRQSRNLQAKTLEGSSSRRGNS